MFQKLVACIQSPANTLLLRALKEKQVWVLEFGIPGDIQLSWAAPNFARPHSIQPPQTSIPPGAAQHLAKTWLPWNLK